ncbi:peptidase M48, Ste24p [Janthinobacterium sp. ROICE36]|uniref:Peptidase M48, Ste24p n=1 Tax=Janthinobacterium svalbardensis TaxID=368607 RepID=A0A290X026_9BURK|nr:MULTISPECIES: peptidase M48, Ste24p [Janthinobacterium]ATD62491.1 peptidase M48, Ste24p [Janthinobacterium svalbardensis]PLY41148.1 peptidase M48, Ste24p [Janthinobacterium sp. ROICE36]
MAPDAQSNTVAGISYAVLIGGFIGSAASLSYAKEMTKKQAVAAFLVGGAVSCAATPLAIHYLGAPAELAGAMAFFWGLGAMRAVPVFFALIDRTRSAKLPILPDQPETKE